MTLDVIPLRRRDGCTSSCCSRPCAADGGARGTPRPEPSRPRPRPRGPPRRAATAARAGGEPRVPAVDHPGARSRQRGAAVGQRGNPVEQRGAAVDQRGARHREGRAAVDQRGAEHRQRRAARRNDELSRVNSDLINLLASVQIAIVIVCADLRIRRFTPMAEQVLNLIPADLDRAIGHINPNIDCPTSIS